MMEESIHIQIKEEYINGTKLMTPRPRYNHNAIQGEIHFQFRSYFKKRCDVSIEGALFLTKDNVEDVKKDKNKLLELIKSKKAEVAPDVAVYCDKNQKFYRGFLGIPQLIVEVLSPSNSEDDTIIKKKLYENFGVPEYWIISPMSKKVFIYVLEDKKYTLDLETNLQEVIRSKRFEDLELDLSELELVEEDF